MRVTQKQGERQYLSVLEVAVEIQTQRVDVVRQPASDEDCDQDHQHAGYSLATQHHGRPAVRSVPVELLRAERATNHSVTDGDNRDWDEINGKEQKDAVGLSVLVGWPELNAVGENQVELLEGYSVDSTVEPDGTHEGGG